MSKVKFLKSVNFILIFFLILGCFYFYNISKINDTQITIGKIKDNTTTYSEEINSIDDRNSINFAIMSAKTISKPKIVNKEPDAIILISDSKSQNIFFKINVWKQDNKIFFDLGKEYADIGAQYKEYVGGNISELFNMLSKYKNNN